MSADLSGLLLPTARGVGAQLITQGVCTAWDAVTHRSTVNVGGSVNYTNLLVLTPALATMAPGPVLLINTPGAPVILGALTVPT